MTGDPSSETPGTSPPGATGESSRARFVDALAVRRNAAAGLVVGAAVATAIFWTFVVAPAETQFAPAWYVPLSLTVTLAVAALVALALTLGRAVWLLVVLDDPEG